MQVTIDTPTLQKIYDAVTTVYYSKLEHKHLVPREELMNLITLKTHLASILDINIIFFKQQELKVDSTFLHSFSKDKRDNLHIEFTLTGLILIQECLDFRLRMLWEYAKEIQSDPVIFSEVNDTITQTEEVLQQLNEALCPMYN